MVIFLVLHPILFIFLNFSVHSVCSVFKCSVGAFNIQKKKKKKKKKNVLPEKLLKPGYTVDFINFVKRFQNFTDDISTLYLNNLSD